MSMGAAAKSNDDRRPQRPLPLPADYEPMQRRPFAWQEGRRLWILDGGPTAWILAELLFDPQSCRYIEVRRANYRWPREAAGALLGRAFAAGQHHAEDAARGLMEWVTEADPFA
jgi:hypothetical protein